MILKHPLVKPIISRVVVRKDFEGYGTSITTDSEDGKLFLIVTDSEDGYTQEIATDR